MSGKGRGKILPWVALLCATSVSSAELVRLTDRAWARIPDDPSFANGALFVGSESALIVDPGPTPSSVAELIAEARAVTDRPLRWIVLSDSHPDHALGALCLGDASIEVVAHPTTRRRLAERFAAMRSQRVREASTAAERQQLEDCRPELPEPALDGHRRFDLGGHRVELFDPGAGGGSGRLVVWSVEERVLSAGDLFLHDGCPVLTGESGAAWIVALDRLVALAPRHVVPGHFAAGGAEDLLRFRAYLQAALERARATASADRAAAEPWEPEPRFASFRRHPTSGATFDDNVRAIVEELARRPAPEGERGAFVTAAVLDVGAAPRQIAFGRDGRQAFVAAAAADRITRVDVGRLRVSGVRPVEGRPTGVAGLPGGELLVSGAESGKLSLFRPGEWSPARTLRTGRSPSSLVGPIDGRRYLISIETEARVRVLDAPTFRYRESYATGRSPLAPAVTADGRKAFVPGQADGTLTVIDLWNDRVADTVEIGGRPNGAAMLADDTLVAVAVAGRDRIAFLNSASHRLVGELSEGLAGEPGAVATSPDGRFLFVGYAERGEVSVLELASRRLIARIPVGAGPASLGIDPSGRRLWVGCGGSSELHVIEIPAVAPASRPESELPTEVAVLGTIHGGHRNGSRWGLEQLRETIRRYAPEIVCAEIPPDRWQRIWTDWAERGAIEDPYILRLPEYTEVLLPLAVELGFDIEPCSAWTREMAELRERRLRQFAEDAGLAVLRAEYERKRAELAERQAAESIVEDDPRVMHSEAYDSRIRAERTLDDEYLGDWIGPGGWSRIDRAHYRLIERALDRHRGRRILILFDARDKYSFLERLRGRPEIRLIDVAPYLPPAARADQNGMPTAWESQAR